MNWFNEFGIEDFGYTEDLSSQTFSNFDNWTKKENHLPLKYLEGDRKHAREHVKNYWADAESALVFIFSYHQSHRELNSIYKNNKNWNGLKIASYTLGFEGEDYHDFLKEKLNLMGERLKIEEGLEYKLVLDTQPVLERELAFKAGLGWFGKNSMLINRKKGSFFIIGSILLNKKLNLKKNKIELDHCGQCTKCIDQCPTSAIEPVTRTIIAKDCISTFTIEQFKEDSIPSDKMDLNSGYIFGCDICQDVCPWNIRLDKILESKHDINSELKIAKKSMKILNFFIFQSVESLLVKLSSMTGGDFEREFKQTSFSRSGKRGLLKNLVFYLKKRNS